MTGLATLQGTWLVLVVAAIPILVSEAASAAPGYPVADPVGGTVPITETATGVVKDPNGQVDCGQIMQQLHELTDEPTSGCNTNSEALSDLGKKQVGSTTDSDGSGPALIETDCTKPEHPENPTPDRSSKELSDIRGESHQAQGKSK